MKKSATLLLLFLSVSLFAQYKTAVDYMDAIGKEYDQIFKATWKYTSAVAHSKSGRKIDKRRKKLIKTIQNSKKTISKMKGWNGDKSYRDTVVSSLNISYNVMVQDYGKIMDLEEVAEQSYDEMEMYLSMQKIANDKLKAANENVKDAQRAFCKANNINLIESKSELGKKMDVASQVYAHYNKVFLIYFKASVQEAKLWTAIQSKDMVALEQAKNALIQYSDEGIKKLDTLSAYKNDKNLIIACKRLLEFYKKEATVEIPKFATFLLEADKFDKLTKKMEANTNRTQADVDNYNAEVKKYNKSLNDFNRMQDGLVQKRSNLLMQWDQKKSYFTDRHVPKD